MFLHISTIFSSDSLAVAVAVAVGKLYEFIVRNCGKTHLFVTILSYIVILRKYICIVRTTSDTLYHHHVFKTNNYTCMHTYIRMYIVI